MLSGWSGYALTGGVCLAALVVLQVVVFAIGRRIGRYNVVDIGWGVGFAVVGATVVGLRAVAGDDAPGGGVGWQAPLVCAAAAIWGLRLAGHLVRATAGKGEDRRYLEMLDKHDGLDADGRPKAGPAFVRIFLQQAGAQWVVSLPLQLLAVSSPARGWAVALVVLGLALWAVGLFFEAVGDAQLEAYKADPDRGPIMDRGLWSWTRHPNYFGDCAVWWGLWCAAAAAGPPAWAVFSPALMTYLLVWATGAKPMEEHMSGREGWSEYAARTPFLLPRPPRKG